jgi:formylglycine-generating enzyme required for sulfatase activity
MAGADRSLRFRLPSETEWEYAARGGPHWRDGFRFSGSDDIDAVAWYGNKWRGGRLRWEILKRLKHWKIFDAQQRGRRPGTHPVALKAPNQLGLHDMTGNVWEWCEDTCAGLDLVPADGTPYLGAGEERRLRGGCHHNWGIHCTVWWRYGIDPGAADGCIGFRLALADGITPSASSTA